MLRVLDRDDVRGNGRGDACVDIILTEEDGGIDGEHRDDDDTEA